MGRKKEEDPGPGHNSQSEPETSLTEDQRRALLLQGVAKIERLQESLESIKGDIRNVRKALKSDGFDRFEVDYALRLRKADETEELDKRRREARIAKWLNHPVGTQPDLFGEVDRTPSVDKAYEAGKIVGLEGGKCEVPHHYGQEQQSKWIEGWHDGQSALATKGFGPLSDASEEEAEEEALA
jgi:uncharacterized protein (UPF0335 family)